MNIRKAAATLCCILMLISLFSCVSISKRARKYPRARIYYKNLAGYDAQLKRRGVRSMTIIPHRVYKRTDTMTEKKEGWRYVKAKDHEHYFIRLDRNFSMTLLTVVGDLIRYKDEYNRTLYKAYFFIESPLFAETQKHHFEGGTVRVYIDRRRNIMAMHAIEYGKDYYIIGYINRWKARGRLF